MSVLFLLPGQVNVPLYGKYHFGLPVPYLVGVQVVSTFRNDVTTNIPVQVSAWMYVCIALGSRPRTEVAGACAAFCRRGHSRRWVGAVIFACPANFLPPLPFLRPLAPLPSPPPLSSPSRVQVGTLPLEQAMCTSLSLRFLLCKVGIGRKEAVCGKRSLSCLKPVL